MCCWSCCGSMKPWQCALQQRNMKVKTAYSLCNICFTVMPKSFHISYLFSFMHNLDLIYKLFCNKMYFRVSSLPEMQTSCCVWVWVEVGHLWWFQCRPVFNICHYVDIVYDWDHPGLLKGGTREFFVLSLIFPQCTSSFPLSFIIAALLYCCLAGLVYDCLSVVSVESPGNLMVGVD